MIDTHIGDLIKYYRKKAGLSQEQLAEGICSREYLVKIERRKTQPGLELISLFSQRLRINLYESYSNVFLHNGMETHLICSSFDQALQDGDEVELKRLIENVSSSEGFLYGEPKQIICYAKAILAKSGKRKEEYLSYVLEGIRVNHPTFPTKPVALEARTNLDFNLLIAYAVFQCKYGDKNEGLELLLVIRQQAFDLLNHVQYESEAHKAFWINTVCMSVYNLFVLSESIDCKYLQIIDDTLNYQKKNNRSCMIAELLFCRASACMNLGRRQEAQKNYEEAMAVGRFFMQPEELVYKRRIILNCHSDLTLFE